MSHYRSIDTGWEFDEIIYVGDGKFKPSEVNLIINGQKSLGIFNGPTIPEYFASISFTGFVVANIVGYRRVYSYRFINGVLQGEIGIKE